ncbi:hypothetical protein FRC12_003112 [Ceratobasidium sp. 428]|nr:hypothetical protein FRC12_003112 [Ceratobasidium sp. 428]
MSAQREFWILQMAFEAAIAAESPNLVGQKLNVGQKRHFSSVVFHQLSEDQQEHWRRVSKEELAAEQAAATLTDPVARERYTLTLLGTLRSLVNEVGQKANVHLAVQVLAEQGEGRFKILSLVSPNLSNFARSGALTGMLNALKGEVEASAAGSQVEGGPPPRDLAINFAHGGQPLFPEVAGMGVLELRPLIWAYFKAMYAKGGGIGSVPWEEICRSLDEWIDPARLPFGFQFGDPGSMTMPQALLITDWIHRHQSRELGPETAFQFRKTYAGSTPINASASQETSRERVQLNGQDVYYLRFDEFVTRCHAVGGIEGMGYTKSAIAYTRFRQTGQALSALSIPVHTPTPPAEWLDLPYGADVSRTAIFGAEEQTILVLAAMLPPEHRERVENIVRLTNNYQSHLPASNDVGAWGSPTPPPKIIPSTPFRTPPVPLFVPVWAVMYYKTPSSIKETVFHIEVWLNSLIDTRALIHQPSGTLFGGDTGVVWVVRVLLVLFFNFAGVKYRIGVRKNCKINLEPESKFTKFS